MKIFFWFFSAILILNSNVNAQQKRTVTKRTTITSPDGKIVAEVLMDKSNTAVYNIKYSGKTILQNSALGIVREDADFANNLQWLSSGEQKRVTDKYKMLNAKKICHYIHCK